MKTFNLSDAVAMNAAHPDTFYLPPEAERTSVRVGDHCKIIFKLEPGKACVAERMWVHVTGVNDDGTYRGEIANEPIYLDAKYLDPVLFTARNVCDILRA